MIVFKGDRVRMASGDTGEVIEIWGIARTFIRLLRDSDRKLVPFMEADVVEVSRAKPARGQKRGR